MKTKRQQKEEALKIYEDKCDEIDRLFPEIKIINSKKYKTN